MKCVVITVKDCDNLEAHGNDCADCEWINWWPAFDTEEECNKAYLKENRMKIKRTTHVFQMRWAANSYYCFGCDPVIRNRGGNLKDVVVVYENKLYFYNSEELKKTSTVASEDIPVSIELEREILSKLDKYEIV